MLSATIYAKNLSAMVDFYQALLWLHPLDQGETFCTLVNETVTLTVAKIPDEIASTFEISSPPEAREHAAIKLSFTVASLDKSLAIVALHGGVGNDAKTAWEHNGWLHLNVVDLEGNVLQLTSPK